MNKLSVVGVRTTRVPRSWFLAVTAALCLAGGVPVIAAGDGPRYRPDNELERIPPVPPPGWGADFPDEAGAGRLTREEFLSRRAQRHAEMERRFLDDNPTTRQRIDELHQQDEAKRARALEELARRQAEMEAEIAREDELIEQRRKAEEAYVAERFPPLEKRPAQGRYPVYPSAPPGYPAPGYPPYGYGPGRW